MGESLNRRSFIKAAAVGCMGAGLFGAVGCAPGNANGDNAAPAFAAGTYSATVNGHNAPLTVQVTFTDAALAGIETPGCLETENVGRFAIDTLAKRMIEGQTLDVDIVSGATVTSMAFTQAVKDCAQQAGANERLASNKRAVEERDGEYDADVCVIGGGGAGCTAAIQAAQQGAHVVIVEKCGILGGSTNVSGAALNAVDPYRQGKKGIEDSIEKHYQSTMEGGHNVGDPVLVRYLVENAMSSVEWLEDLGCAFKIDIGAATGSLGERSHYPAKSNGAGIIDAFKWYIGRNPQKISVLSNAQATEFATDGSGAITALKGTFSDDSPFTVTASSFVIATGGFGANVEFRQKVNTGVWSEAKLDDSIGCTNIKPCAQGEGLALAESVGAELIGLSDIQLHPNGTPGTGLMGNISTAGRNRIFVNESGDRFVNEGAARDELCKAIFQQPNSTYWIVVNKVRYPSESDYAADGSKIENMLAIGSIVKGETLDELAEAAGMDPAKLKASIDTYNAVLDGTAADPLGFEATNVADAPLTEGPWYACKKVPTVHHTMGGIKIDVDTQVLDASGTPIKNLYAAGECTGGIHGANRLGGNAVADIITFGRNAGVQAAQNAGR